MGSEFLVVELISSLGNVAPTLLSTSETGIACYIMIHIFRKRLTADINVKICEVYSLHKIHVTF